MALLSIPTAPLHGYQVLFSPYSPHRLAFTGAQNYGITGNGCLVLYEKIEGRGFVEVRRYLWKDGLFDVTWSELSEDVLVVGGGDASVLVFDQKVSRDPVAVLSGHTAEVSSVQWSVTRQEQLVLSSSWDGSVRVWDPQSRSCVSVFTHHQGIVYSASWAPHLPRTFASVSGDEQICLWDLSQPNPTTIYHAHSGELLSCDWSKYDPNVLFTGGVDTAVRMWDIRNLTSPVLVMGGHTQAVRRIKCDPFRGNIVLSCSYDFTVRVWDVGRPATPLLDTIGHHREFTFGLDLSALEQGKE
ncbi:peroxisomal targeting signal 2 receptor-like isoform X2 [Halichondria panicea]|uniref:peroxisomal targeting signal 2 receptor-like isoform X2 n=1 Tax=Halichondria panicea TaxID=6063 RepID=UPI00312B6A38